MALPVIAIENLSYTYKGSIKKTLDDLTFSIDELECCGIIGPSESGKTTLCYALASVLRHHFAGGKFGGRIFLKGLDVFSTPLDLMTTHVGLLMQNSYLQLSGIKPTVIEEVAFSMENLSVAREEMIQRADQMMKDLGIAHLASRNPLTLSGGEKQRVALASILALDPPVLILDEPTSSLDPDGVRDLSVILKRMKGKKTILLIEQKMEILPGLVDSVLALRDGKIVHRGSPQDFFSNPINFEEEIGAPIWTEIVYQLEAQVGRPNKSLPYTYRQALYRLFEIH